MQSLLEPEFYSDSLILKNLLENLKFLIIK